MKYIFLFSIIILIACSKDDTNSDNRKKTPYEDRQSLYKKWWYVKQSKYPTSHMYLINDTTLAATFHITGYGYDSAIFKYRWVGDSAIVSGVRNLILDYTDSTLKTYIGDSTSGSGMGGIALYSTKK